MAAPLTSCKAPMDMVRFTKPLPKLADEFRAHKPLRIIAFGSSSTAGSGASSKKNAYPSQLESQLRQRWPGREVQVINAGIGGQLVTDMMARLERDVLKNRPALVIWQTGVNDAIKGVDIAKFKQLVLNGIDRMRLAGIDVVLLDQQYYPRAEKLPHFQQYLQSLAEASQERGIPILHRFRIMKHLVSTSQFALQDLLAPDGFHLNDLSYRCLGTMMADAIAGAVTPPMQDQLSAEAKPEGKPTLPGPQSREGTISPLLRATSTAPQPLKPEGR